MFFLFKQKTAYEMRISDWSSDVCSSDLSNMSIPHLNALPVIAPKKSLAATAVFCGGRIAINQESKRYVRRFWTIGKGTLYCVIIVRTARCSGEIGRASCRERVCQTV